MPRRPLQNLGGPTRTGGDVATADVLRHALETVEREPADLWTHGFHSYPARMHPAIARAVVTAWSQPGGRVLDPFCGSGTVPLEAMVAGRRAAGCDLNPLALRIAATKCERRGPHERAAFEMCLRSVVEASKRRVRGRVRIDAPLSRAECQYYAPHVLKELAGLWAEIGAIEAPAERAALEVLFSAIVVKFSRQRADTSREQVDKRIGRFIPSEFFERKGLEWLERWEALETVCAGVTTHVPHLVEGDARRLPEMFRPVDLVLTSPPYGGTYDYVEHHARRLAWLGLSTRNFAARELGARRHLQAPEDAQRWDDDVRAMLQAMAAVLTPAGVCVLLVGDGQLGHAASGAARIDALAQLGKLVPAAGLRIAGWASQNRPDWQGGRARTEWLFALRHATRAHG